MKLRTPELAGYCRRKQKMGTVHIIKGDPSTGDRREIKEKREIKGKKTIRGFM